MHSVWKKLREETKPSSSFSEDLRAKLYEKSVEKESCFFIRFIEKIRIPKPNLVLKIEKQISFGTSVKQFLQSFQNLILRMGLVVGGAAMAMILIVPLFSLFTTAPSSASNPSLARNLEGSIAIQRNGNVFYPEENQEIFNSDLITTGSNGNLEIIFFEGTIVRIAPNSQVEIETLSPHPFLFTSGGATIKLKKGKVWIKTFQLTSQENGVTLKTPNTTILPEKAAFTAVYMDGKESIIVLENRAVVNLDGIIVEDNVAVHAGELIQFSPFDEFTPLNETLPLSAYEGWVTENLNKDTEYTKEFLEKISTAMKEEYVLEELSEQIHTFLESNPNPDEVERLIEEINTLMLFSENTETVDMETESEENQEEETNTPSPTPQTKYVYTPSIRYIPAATKATGNSASVQTEREDEEPTALADDMVEEEMSIESVIVPKEKTASEIAKEYYKKEKEEKLESAAESFSEQVESFKFEVSRSTQAQNILDKIPDEEDSIELLKKMEETAPRDVKSLVKRKRIELEKEALDAEENLKNSAPLEDTQMNVPSLNDSAIIINAPTIL